VQVNESVPGSQSLPRDGGGRQVATSSTAGVTAVVWYDDVGDNVWVRRFDALGVGGSAQQVHPSGQDWRSPAVAMAADGRFVVVGIQGDQVWARRYDDTGTAVGPSFRVDAGSADASQPSVAMNASGAFVIAWRRDMGGVNGQDVVVQRFTADGTPDGGLLEVAATRSGDQSAPAVALRDDGSFAVAYTGPYSGDPAIFIRQFSASASPELLDEQKLAALGETAPPRGVDVVVDGFGRYLVVWDVPGGAAPGLYARIATQTGHFPIGVQRLDDAPPGGQVQRPSVAALAPGRFAVAWESDADLDGDDRAVHLRTFDTNAVPVGPSQRLNDWTEGDQEAPSIAARGGTVYAAWSGASANDDDGVVLRQVAIPVPAIDVVVGGTATGEAGAPLATLDVRLSSAPTASVQITLAVSDPLEGRVSMSALSFGPGNWMTPQRVTVQGVDDRVVDGPRPFSVTFAITSADPGYAGLTVAPIGYTNADDDTRNEVVVNTLADVVDGDVASLAALVRAPGADGGISLREALRAANATANGSGGVDRITFDLPGDGARTILLGSALPVITDAVEIDGHADPDFLAGDGPVVVLQPASAPAAFNGLELGATVSGATIRGLAIGGMSRGIVVHGSGNLIESNFVGTDATGQLDVGNRFDGIRIDGGDGNIVRNTLIGGNGESGIELRGGAVGNVIEDNRIGTNAAGTAALGNDTNGVYLVGAEDTVVRNNLIGGNGWSGVRLDGSGSHGNRVVGNTIGESADGAVALANGQAGVLILNGASDNLIGGPDLGDGNRIVGNAQAGVRVVDGSGLSRGNAIVRNTIDGPALGIDLGATFATPIAVTANDPGDADAGGNGAQNAPVLTSVVTLGLGQLTVGGTLDSAASTRYRIDVYADPTPNPTGHGEAATWLGHFEVTTDAAGGASFSQALTPSAVPAVGTAMTATATRVATDGALRDTSEFAPNRALAAPMAFTNLPARSVVENTLEVATLRVTASGQPAPAATYAIVADPATDGARFEIVGGDRLRFRTAPDFEAPADGDGDNRYTVRVTATDGPYVATLTMTVQVTDATTGLVPATGAVPASPPAAGSQHTTETGGRAVAMLPGGGAVVVWTDTAQGSAQVWARRLDRFGDPIGTAWRVDPNTGSASQAAVAADASGRIAIVWAENEAGAGDVRLQVWQPDLATADPTDLVPATAVVTVNTDTAGRQAEPAIAADPRGGWVVSWTQGDATDSQRPIFMRRFDASGAPATAPALVSNPANIAPRAHSAVGVAADGTVVVAYAFDSAGDNTWGVFVRVFEADGTARTGWIEVDTQPAGPQTQPELSVAPDGRFVVVWTDLPAEATPENGEGARARIYGSNGNPLTGEIALDSFAVGAQHAPTVAMLADGGFVAAWQSSGQDAAGTEGIVIRRFGATGAKLTAERIATPHVAGDQIRPSLAVQGNRIVLVWSGAAAADAEGVALRSFDVVDPGFAVVPVVPGPTGLALAEDGGSVAFDLVATAEPGAPVTVRVALPPAADGRVTLSAAEFTFGPSTWNQPQRLFVTSLPDALADGELTLRLTAEPSSADPAFATLAPITHDLVRADDDTGPGPVGATDWTVLEGRTVVGRLTGIGTDAGTDGLIWSIVLGDDGAAFTIDADTGDLAFVDPPDFERPVDQDGDGLYLLRVRQQDSLGGTVEGVHRVQVTDRNEAPVVTLPASVAGLEDTPLRFGPSADTALSVTDPDTTAAPLRVTLSVDRGRLTLAGVEGLSFERGDGTADRTLWFTGTPEDVAAALASVLYQPEADHSGTVTLRLTARDAGNAALQADAQLEIVLQPVNDAPVLRPNAADPISAQSGARLALGRSALRASDVDHAADAVVYTVVEAPAGGMLQLGRTRLAVGDRFSQADVNAGRLSFVASSPGEHSLTFEVVDGDNASAGEVTLRIKVDASGRAGAAATSAPAASTAAVPVPARADGTAPADAAPARDAGSAGDGGAERAAPAAAAASAGGGGRSASGAHSSRELGGVALALAGRNEEVVAPGIRADRHTAVLRLSADPSPFRLSEAADVRERSARVRTEVGAAMQPALRSSPIAGSGSVGEPSRPWSPVAALRQADFREALTRVREDAAASFEVRGALVASTAAITTSLSIGYVVWLLRGGVLLTSLLASMPAWRSIDPLPVLARTDARGRDAEGEDDSLRGLLARAAERQAPDAAAARAAAASRAEADAVSAGASA
jgi:hypothetical protein